MITNELKNKKARITWVLTQNINCGWPPNCAIQKNKSFSSKRIQKNLNFVVSCPTFRSQLRSKNLFARSQERGHCWQKKGGTSLKACARTCQLAESKMEEHSVDQWSKIVLFCGTASRQHVRLPPCIEYRAGEAFRIMMIQLDTYLLFKNY